MNDDPPAGTAGRGAGLTERQLLQSVTATACNLFGAAAATVFLRDPATGDLIFEAISGEGEERLIGTRFPAGTGIVGWVAASGQPLLVDDLTSSAEFAREAAESSGYMPSNIMAAPLIRDDRCLGVLEVLDRGSRSRGDLQDIDLLGLLAAQAAIGVELLERLLRTPGGNGSADRAEADSARLIRRIAERLPAATDTKAGMVARLLAVADEILAAEVPGRPEG